MKNFKKVKYRLNFPETNSSSTHSLVINPSFFPNVKQIKEDLSPFIDENGTLIIHSRDFGWEVEKHKNTYVKIQYAVAQLSTRFCEKDIPPQASKKLSYIKYLITKYSGIKDVKFELQSSVDHQSQDLLDEIYESPETLEKFLFGEGSWLYLSNDNGGDEFNIYEYEDDTDYGYCKLLLPPGEVGEIEIPIQTASLSIKETLGDNSYIIYGIGIKDGKSIANPNIDDPDILNYTRLIIKIDKVWYAIWADKDTKENLIGDSTRLTAFPWSSYDPDDDPMNEIINKVKKLIEEKSPKVYPVKVEVYSDELGTFIEETDD